MCLEASSSVVLEVRLSAEGGEKGGARVEVVMVEDERRRKQQRARRCLYACSVASDSKGGTLRVGRGFAGLASCQLPAASRAKSYDRSCPRKEPRADCQ